MNSQNLFHDLHFNIKGMTVFGSVNLFIFFLQFDFIIDIMSSFGEEDPNHKVCSLIIFL